MWASGDFSVIATLIQSSPSSSSTASTRPPARRVLDVAGGTGNAAIAAARCGCDVTCTDYVPALLERGRERARAERLAIEFAVADAEALPFARRRVRRRPVRLRRDVRPRPAAGRRRAGARVPVGRADRASRAGRPSGFLGDCSAPGRDRPAAGRASRRRCAGAPRRASPSCSGDVAGRSAPGGARSPGASRRRRVRDHMRDWYGPT